MMAGIAPQAEIYGQPATPPAMLLSGGETKVTRACQGFGPGW
jgi:glycerate-2-kinase